MSNKERIKENKKLQKRLQGPYLEYYTKVHSNLKKSITSAHHPDMLHPMLTVLLQAQEKSMDVEQFMGQEASGYSALMLKNHSKQMVWSKISTMILGFLCVALLFMSSQLFNEKIALNWIQLLIQLTIFVVLSGLGYLLGFKPVSNIEDKQQKRTVTVLILLAAILALVRPWLPNFNGGFVLLDHTQFGWYLVLASLLAVLVSVYAQSPLSPVLNGSILLVLMLGLLTTTGIIPATFFGRYPWLESAYILVMACLVLVQIHKSKA